MTHHSSNRLSSFSSRWLAEALRLQLQEKGQGADAWQAGSSDAEALDKNTLPDNASGPEKQILLRARQLPESVSLLEAMGKWRSQLRLSLLFFCVLALVAGFSTALGVLGDSNRAVNVIWAVGSLLGLHLLMLALWAATLLLPGQTAGGTLGRLWLWASTRLAPKAAYPVLNSFASLTTRAGLSRWYLGSVTHLLWCLALCAAALALLMALSLRSYSFVWETTILPADTFVALVQGMGWLPAQLGFTVPDSDMLRMSSLAGNESPLAQPDAARQAWSSWLLGCVLVYGILPRLLLALLCMTMLKRGLQALRLDLSSSAWAQLAAQLSPESARMGITDPVTGSLPLSRFSSHAGASAPPVLVGLEQGIPDHLSLDVPPQTRVMSPVDSREQRHLARQSLQENPPGRLLIACDSAVSPDRGNLNWMAALSALAGHTNIWLLNSDGSPQRLAAWRAALSERGLPEAQVLDNRIAALRWLQGESP